MYGSRGGDSAAHSKTFPRPTLSNFDLRAYLDGYKGTTKIRRAMYVAENCHELATEGYLAALDELEAATYNTRLHDEVSKRLEQLGVALPSKVEWRRNADQMALRETSELTKEIDSCKSANLVPACQKAYKKLVELNFKKGNIEEAFRTLQAAREVGSDAEDHNELQISAARIAQSTFRWTQVTTYVQRTRAAVTAQKGAAAWPEGTVVQLQANVGDSKWSDVARGLGELKLSESDASAVFEIGNITQRDLALYAALSALIAMRRKDIKEKFINNLAFGKYFEAMPECLELLKEFHASRYSTMLALLDRVLSFCVLDPVIGPHVAHIKRLIVDNIVILYSTPYVTVSLEAMARELCLASVDTLETILVRLITTKRIVARIDAVSGYLYKYKVDPRDAALAHIEKMYKSFDGHVDLLKAHIMFLEEESRRASGPRSQRARA
ncbi:hypothetical protein EV175_002226 [Coemansia sp. RSA 1933]|nr:hypothetical protein EV175_002226 [Coemansia sp. RSA 1933]